MPHVYERDNALFPRRVVIAFLHSPNHSHHHHLPHLPHRRHWGFFCVGWHLAEDLQSGGNNTNYVLLDDAIPLPSLAAAVVVCPFGHPLAPSLPRFSLSLSWRSFLLIYECHSDLTRREAAVAMGRGIPVAGLPFSSFARCLNCCAGLPSGDWSILFLNALCHFL